MLLENTNLNTGAQLLAETLRTHYRIDPEPLFESVGLDPTRISVAGARYPRQRMIALWEAAVSATGDPGLGLVVGARVRITTFHAIGFAWLASQNLLEAMQRLCRYYRLLSSGPARLVLDDIDADTLRLTARQTDSDGIRSANATVDAFALAVVQLCRLAGDRHFRPLSVHLDHGDQGDAGAYVRAFDAPVIFSAGEDALYLDRASLLTPLPGENAEIAHANEQVAEHYLASLDPERVATTVRELLVDMLPSGEASQELVAGRMNRSLSTLQRQLHAEGLSFQQVRDETRRRLAEGYIREKRMSLSEIAYLLGFSDQSNFSRAFRRWTGKSPREYQA